MSLSKGMGSNQNLIKFAYLYFSIETKQLYMQKKLTLLRCVKWGIAYGILRIICFLFCNNIYLVKLLHTKKRTLSIFYVSQTL